MAAVCQYSLQRGQPTTELIELVSQAQTHKDRLVEIIAEHALGILYLDLNDTMSSRSHLVRALELSRTNGLRRYEAYTEAWLAAVDEADGNPPDVRSRFRTAETLKTLGDRRCEAFALLRDKRTGRATRRPGAGSVFSSARRGDRRSVWRCRDGTSSRNYKRRGSSLRRATGRTDGGTRRSLSGSENGPNAAQLTFSDPVSPRRHRRPDRASLLRRSRKPAWASRLFQRELSARRSLPHLRVCPMGVRFSSGAQPKVGLPDGRMIRAILRVLAEARVQGPGRGIPVRGFVERCWSDERVSERVGSQRYEP